MISGLHQGPTMYGQAGVSITFLQSETDLVGPRERTLPFCPKEKAWLHSFPPL